MPAGDGTGPTGMGPMTGRAAGFCAGFAMPGYQNPVAGAGFGMGFGRGRGAWGRGGGRGWRNAFYAPGLPGWQRAAPVSSAWATAAAPTKSQQVEALKNQAEYFEGALGELRKRIEEIESDKTE